MIERISITHLSYDYFLEGNIVLRVELKKRRARRPVAA